MILLSRRHCALSFLGHRGLYLLEVKVGLDETEAAVFKALDIKALLVTQEELGLVFRDLTILVGVKSMSGLETTKSM